MKQVLFLLISCAFYLNTTAQKLDNCSQCSFTQYSPSDITKNKLYEIILLRNEIFARHHYSFKNQRLQEYYSQYNWYQPNAQTPIKNVDLNKIEQKNIALFKKQEKTIRENRALLVSNLEKFKRGIEQHDEVYIQFVFNDVVKKNTPTLYLELVMALQKVLRSINIEDINWHKGKAKYEIRIDNGAFVSMKSLFIEGNKVSILYTNPMQHSDLMEEDAFIYPSMYYSEDENTIGAEFELKDGEFFLTRLILAG